MDIITFLTLGLIILLSAFYLLRQRLKIVLANTLHILFIVSVVLGITALFVPQPYSFVADTSLRTVGTFDQLKDYDKAIPFLPSDVENSDNIIDTITGWFAGNEDNQNDQIKNQGFLEKKVYPQLVSALTLILRILSVILSIAGLIVAIYAGYAFENTSQTNSLQKRIEQLEQEVAVLKGR